MVVGGRAKLIKRKGIGRRAQGYFGHLASPSLGHYATLSFVVRGKGINIAAVLSHAASFLFAGIPVSKAQYLMAAVLGDVL